MKYQNLKRQLEGELIKKLHRGVGTSKHANKKAGDAAALASKIYSYSTYHSYKKQVAAFALWIKTAHPDARYLDQARPLVGEWLQSRMDRGLSADTIALGASALAKAYSCHKTDFGVRLPRRSRDNITRSRGTDIVARINAGQTPPELALLGRCYGLRRSEWQQVRLDDLRPVGDGYIIRVRSGKGGKARDVRPVSNAVERAKIAAYIDQRRAAGADMLLDDVPAKAGTHALRRTYAQRVYKAIARPTDDLPQRDRYCCRGSHRGTVFDRQAIQTVSRMLGHARCDVVVNSYLI